MVSTTHQQYPDWSINKIAQRIYIKNQELEGFSTRTVYRCLNEENRQLLDQTKPIGVKHAKNNVLEEKFDNGCQTNVIEESSSYAEPQISEEEADEILQDVGIEEEEEQNKEFHKWRLLKTKEEEIKRQLPKEVVEYAEKYQLSTSKLELLNHPKLKKYPILQEHLVYDIKDYSPQKANDKVYQTISDLETKYLVPSETGKVFTYSGDPDKRDLIKGNKREVKHPEMAYLDIIKSVHKLCEELTGHKLESGEFKYTDDHFKYTKEYRQEIVRNNNDKRSLIALNNQLVLIADYADDFIAMIKDALDDIDKKPNLSE